MKFVVKFVLETQKSYRDAKFIFINILKLLLSKGSDFISSCISFSKFSLANELILLPMLHRLNFSSNKGRSILLIY